MRESPYCFVQSPGQNSATPLENLEDARRLPLGQDQQQAMVLEASLSGDEQQWQTASQLDRRPKKRQKASVQGLPQVVWQLSFDQICLAMRLFGEIVRCFASLCSSSVNDARFCASTAK